MVFNVTISESGTSAQDVSAAFSGVLPLNEVMTFAGSSGETALLQASVDRMRAQDEFSPARRMMVLYRFTLSGGTSVFVQPTLYNLS